MVRVSAVFEKETLILFERSQSSIILMYSCEWAEAMSGFEN